MSSGPFHVHDGFWLGGLDTRKHSVYMARPNGQASDVQAIDKKLLNEVTRRLAAEFHPEQVWLFGSHAWGEPNEGSDLDLLVVVKESAEGPPRRAQRAHRCLRGMGIAKDVIVKTRAEFDRLRSVPSSLDAQIVQRGRLIYGSSEA